MKVPEELIKQIADELETGFQCFLNPETLELIALPDKDDIDGMDKELWQEDIDKLDEDPDKYVEIEEMTSTESYRVMEDFVEIVNDNKVKNALQLALTGHKPFANFKLRIDQSGPFRNKWFEYRTERITQWVIEQIAVIK